MTALSTSAKEVGKNTPAISPKSSSDIITPNVEEIKAPRTLQDFFASLDKKNFLAKQYNKYSERLKEIRDFDSLISDSSSCKLVIEHASGKKIEFPHINIIQGFVKEQFRNGEREVLELENDMKNFVE